jgi:hypothetical protein
VDIWKQGEDLWSRNNMKPQQYNTIWP